MKPVYLYVTPFFPSVSRWQGGFCYDAVKALERDGRYDVRVVLTGLNDQDYEYNGIKVLCIKRIKLPCDCAPFLFTGLNGRILLRKLKNEHIKESEIAVCHANMEPEYAYAVKKRNPSAIVIWQTHWMGAPFTLSVYRLGVIRGLSDLLYIYWRRMLEAVDIVTVLSKLHVEQFGKAYPDGPLGKEIDVREQTLYKRYRRIVPKKMVVFYNGIDTSVFCPGERCHNGHFTIGCIGNFGPTKGQMTLIKAFESVKPKLPDAKLVFIGSGPCLESCKAEVEKAGLADSVKFEQECDHLKLPNIYRSFDLFALPSWQEGFCCVLVEAAGCGTPVVTTDAISFKEVIPPEDYAKWLFKPRDHEQLADKILNFYKCRYHFAFARSMDINLLWEEFLDEVCRT